MPRIKQIPLDLLTQEIKIIKHQNSAESSWTDQSTNIPGPTISHVRVQEVMQLVTGHGSNNAQALLEQGVDYIVFIDAVNSNFVDERYIPTLQDQVLFNGHKHQIKQVSAVVAFGPQVHHWELMCT